MYPTIVRLVCLLSLLLVPSTLSAAREPQPSIAPSARRSYAPAITGRSVIAPVADIGRLTTLVAVSGTLALVGRRFEFAFYDIGDPSQPVLLARVGVPGLVLDAAFDGDRVYLLEADYPGSGGSTLSIFDLRDPRIPVQLGQYRRLEGARRLRVAHNLAYVVDHAALHILDVSHPELPTLLGRIQLTGATGYSDVQIIQHRAYLVDDTGVFWVVDVADPANAKVLGSEVSAPFRSVDVVGTIAYLGQYNIAGAANPGFEVVDIAEPAHPVRLGSFDTGVGEVAQVKVFGNIAYLQIVGSQNNRMLMLDIGNPAAPVQVGQPLADVMSMWLAPGRAYLATRMGWQTIDVHDPGHPISIWHSESPILSATAVRVVDGLAYVLDPENTPGGLVILDVHDPRRPVLVGRYTPAQPEDKVSFAGLQVQNGIAYLQREAGGLDIVDVGNPSAPVLRGRYRLPASIVGLQIVETRAYLLYNDCDYSQCGLDGNGLQILDVHDPGRPLLLGKFRTLSAGGMQIEDQRAYIVAGGLRIVDIHDPAHPTHIAGGMRYSFGDLLAVVGTYAYFKPDKQSHALSVVDVGDPLAPVQVAEVGLSMPVADLALVDDLLFAVERYDSGSRSAIDLIDIGNLGEPVPIAHYELPRYPWRVEPAGNLIYVADGAYGLQILEVSPAITSYLPQLMNGILK